MPAPFRVNRGGGPEPRVDSARNVPRIVAVAVLGTDLAVLVLNDVFDLVRLGRFPACSFCFVLGAVAGAERSVSALALVLPLAIFVVRLDVTLSHCTLPLPFRILMPAAKRG